MNNRGRPRAPPLRRLMVAAGVSAASVAAPLGAQVVRVAVEDAATQVPAPGAVVSLTDSIGRRVVSGLTDERGVMVLLPPATGRFAVRAERVGTDAWTSGAPVLLTPERSDTLAVDVVLAPRTTWLGPTVVRADRRCDRLAEADGSAASVWQAASAALAATALNEREGRVRTRIRLYERELTPGGRVESERVTGEGPGTGRPFTTRTPEQLATDGYVRPAGAGADYFGPDAAALLSAEIAATHCVRLVRGQNAEAGLVGLAFDIVPGRAQPEIAGTLWVDEATAALRHVAYRYVHVPSPEAHLDVPATAVATGRVEFAPGAGGAWLVRRWWLRVPKLVRPPIGPRLGAGPGGGGSPTYRSTYLVAGYMEVGCRSSWLTTDHSRRHRACSPHRQHSVDPAAWPPTVSVSRTHPR